MSCEFINDKCQVRDCSETIQRQVLRDPLLSDLALEIDEEFKEEDVILMCSNHHYNGLYLCKHGLKMGLKQSKTAKNPDRWYYTCRASRRDEVTGKYVDDCSDYDWQKYPETDGDDPDDTPRKKFNPGYWFWQDTLQDLMSGKQSAGWANADGEEETEICSTHSSDQWGAGEKVEESDSWDDSNWGDDILPPPVDKEPVQEPVEEQLDREPTPTTSESMKDSAFVEIKELDPKEKEDFNVMKEEIVTLSQKLSQVKSDNLQLTANLRHEENEQQQAQRQIEKQKAELESLREHNTLLEKHLSDALKALALKKSNSFF